MTTSILAHVSHYQIPRTEEDRRESLHDRAFTMALRWHPTPDVDPTGRGGPTDTVEAAHTTLRRLMQGDTVSRTHLVQARRYLCDAANFYASEPWEPYPGRNLEAYADVTALRDLLSDPPQT